MVPSIKRNFFFANFFFKPQSYNFFYNNKTFDSLVNFCYIIAFKLLIIK